MKKSLLITLILAALHLFAQAQSSVGIDSINYSAPAGGSFNAQYTFVVNVANYGPQPISETLDIMYVVDTTGTGVTTLGSDTSYSHTNFFTIAVGAEQTDSALVTFSPGVFRQGINTVVIWPRSTSNALITTHDSLKIYVMILASGIESHSDSRSLIFPNPSSQVVHIVSPAGTQDIERVRIFDTEGRLVSDEKFNRAIDIRALHPGVYYLELLNLKGNIIRYKIIKE